MQFVHRRRVDHSKRRNIILECVYTTKLISEALVIQNNDIQTPGNFVAQGTVIATTISDRFMELHEGSFSNVTGFECVGLFNASVISDGVLNIQNGSLNAVSNVNCDRLDAGKLTVGNTVLENNDIRTTGNFISQTGHLVCGFIRDNFLTINEGRITNAVAVETDSVECASFTNGSLRINQGNIQNANIVSSVSFTDGYLHIKAGWITGIRGLEGNVASVGGSAGNDKNALSDGVIEIRNGVIRNVDLIEAVSLTDGCLYIHDGSLQNAQRVETNELLCTEVQTRSFSDSVLNINKGNISNAVRIEVEESVPSC